jgi:hypothetical protein
MPNGMNKNKTRRNKNKNGGGKNKNKNKSGGKRRVTRRRSSCHKRRN